MKLLLALATALAAASGPAQDVEPAELLRRIQQKILTARTLRVEYAAQAVYAEKAEAGRNEISGRILVEGTDKLAHAMFSKAGTVTEGRWVQDGRFFVPAGAGPVGLADPAQVTRLRSMLAYGGLWSGMAEVRARRTHDLSTALKTANVRLARGDGDIDVLSYDLSAADGTGRKAATLWVHRSTLAPVRQRVDYAADGLQGHFDERYAAFVADGEVPKDAFALPVDAEAVAAFARIEKAALSATGLDAAFRCTTRLTRKDGTASEVACAGTLKAREKKIRHTLEVEASGVRTETTTVVDGRKVRITVTSTGRPETVADYDAPEVVEPQAAFNVRRLVRLGLGTTFLLPKGFVKESAYGLIALRFGPDEGDAKTLTYVVDHVEHRSEILRMTLVYDPRTHRLRRRVLEVGEPGKGVVCTETYGTYVLDAALPDAAFTIEDRP
jgi:hypothetical protein